MKTAVLGAGGQGCFFAAHLARAGEDVTLVGRGSGLDKIARDGIVLWGPADVSFRATVPTSDNPAGVGAVDLLVVCVKSHDLESAAVTARPLVGPSTTVLPVQNGVDAAARLGSALGDGHVIAGVSYISAHSEAPGVVVFGAVAGRVEIGEVDGPAGERVEAVRKTLSDAGIATVARDDMGVAVWEKFVLVCATGGVLAYARAPMGRVLASEEGPTLLRGVMYEAAAVGRADGIGLPDDTVERHYAFIRERVSPSARSSMLVDLLAGRRLELDALNGAVVRMGRDYGVPTPFNAAICSALKPYVGGGRPGTGSGG